MIEQPPLLTVKRPGMRPDETQIAAFTEFPASVVTDAMEGCGALSSDISPLGHGLPARAVGPALTVGCGPADILALLGALKFVRPGDILIVSVEGHQGCAVFGDRFAGMLSNAGASGIVTDGPVRDAAGIAAEGVPVWCTGLTPASPYSNGPGTIGLPVQIGGQTVETGDIVVADGDGVVVVPKMRSAEVLERSRRIIELEKALEEEIRCGLVQTKDIVELMESDKVRWVE